MNTTFERVKEICKESHPKRVLQRYLNLVILVDKNYEHIEQLETLRNLFGGELDSYTKQSKPELCELYSFMEDVCRNTFNNHYINKNDVKKYPSVYDVQREVFGGDSPIPSFRALAYNKPIVL